MNTLLLSNSEKDIYIAAKIIKNGGIVAMPTETVYGLAANALNGNAVKKIFEAKKRPMDNPLIVHIGETGHIKKYNLVSEIPEKATMLAKHFWPGPLTIIMKKSEVIPDEVSAGLDTVAIRFPSHNTAQQLILASDTPLAAPSANLSGSPSPTNAQHVFDDMNGSIDAIIDGGTSDVGVESTVITLAENPPRLLRPGGITLEQMEKVIGKIEVDNAVLNKLTEGQTASSPGMKYKHYAPKAKVVLLNGNDEKFIEFINKNASCEIAAICYDEDLSRLSVESISIGGKNDYNAQAHNLFNALRKIDTIKGIKIVYAHCPKTTGVSMAVYNRLIRAAGFEVTSLEKL